MTTPNSRGNRILSEPNSRMPPARPSKMLLHHAAGQVRPAASQSNSLKLLNQGMVLLILLGLCASAASAARTYSVTGLVLKIDKAHQRLLVSCQSIPGYRDAMATSYAVRDPNELEGLTPGMIVEFTLVLEQESVYAEHIHVHEYQSVEQDPLTARRLKLLDSPSSSARALEVGERVPEFALTDQKRQQVALSQFSGQVVLLNFIYTRCILPNYCLRITNNFGVLQRRFKALMGRDLVFLTVTFDPVHDTPEVLAHHASIWKANPETWHFLTGATPDVVRLCNLFGVDFFPDEGLMDHSLRTAIIDRAGKLVANLEGNDFSADQLGDLVQIVLDRKVAR
jgi:protein SCO1